MGEKPGAADAGAFTGAGGVTGLAGMGALAVGAAMGAFVGAGGVTGLAGTGALAVGATKGAALGATTGALDIDTGAVGGTRGTGALVEVATGLLVICLTSMAEIMGISIAPMSRMRIVKNPSWHGMGDRALVKALRAEPEMRMTSKSLKRLFSAARLKTRAPTAV
jgi:hypothetical protein